MILPVRPLAALSAVANPPALAAVEVVHVRPVLPAEAANTLVLNLENRFLVVDDGLNPPNVDARSSALANNFGIILH